jgi:hypothetical protein
MDLGSEVLTIRASKLPNDQHKHLLLQMQAKRRMAVNPGFAAMIDVDCYQIDPLSVDVFDFIESSMLQVETGLGDVTARR